MQNPQSFDPGAGPLTGPPIGSTALEFLAGAELLKLASWPWIRSTLPRGGGEPVLVFPGFGTGDSATAILRWAIDDLGYRAKGWQIGLNNGNVPKLLESVVDVVRREADREGRPLKLVGWSLGGYLAREAARDLPDCVDRVVTLGSPVVGGPKYTLTAPLYRAIGVDVDAIEVAVKERESVPIGVPVTAIFSKRDGIVGWRACIDRVSPEVEHVEVDSSHTGLGFVPEALRAVATALAA